MNLESHEAVEAKSSSEKSISITDTTMKGDVSHSESYSYKPDSSANHLPGISITGAESLKGGETDTYKPIILAGSIHPELPYDSPKNISGEKDLASDKPDLRDTPRFNPPPTSESLFNEGEAKVDKAKKNFLEKIGANEFRNQQPNFREAINLSGSEVQSAVYEFNHYMKSNGIPKELNNLEVKRKDVVKGIDGIRSSREKEKVFESVYNYLITGSPKEVEYLRGRGHKDLADKVQSLGESIRKINRSIFLFNQASTEVRDSLSMRERYGTSLEKYSDPDITTSKELRELDAKELKSLRKETDEFRRDYRMFLNPNLTLEVFIDREEINWPDEKEA